MFNNLINIHDLTRLIDRINQSESRLILSKLIRFRGLERVKRSWAHVDTYPKNWWEIPAVRERWNLMIAGDRKIDYQEYIGRRYLIDRTPLKGLSIGCGTGSLLFRWLDLLQFETVDAYDLSSARIDYARKEARDNGLERIINFMVADIRKVELRSDYYDMVIAEGVLHHLSPLKETLSRLRDAMRPDGYLVINEFVGPKRFQWTDDQIGEVNRLLSIIPERYRVKWRDGSIKSRVFRPGRLSMILNDPSEAVESSAILPLLHREFDVVEVKGFGGNILHLLFAGIAHNFLSQDAETEKILNLCFEAEDAFLARGDVRSDFVIGIFRKR
ncbi:MAG TPA: class I SAM-dependent methyltransferase [bacterium (Candidatus Stahlbacteria)]|nr:class I SAM-dependent methyltransferase [Candidatus Stahlbacteria bacterium]